MSVNNLLSPDRQTYKALNIEDLIVHDQTILEDLTVDGTVSTTTINNTGTITTSTLNSTTLNNTGVGTIHDLYVDFFHPPTTFPSAYFCTNSGGNLGNGNFERYGSESTEINSQVLFSVNVVISDLRVQLSSAPGGTAQRTFTVRKNGINTSLLVTITGSATTGYNNVNTVNFVAGDLLSIQHTTTGGASAANGRTCVKIG